MLYGLVTISVFTLIFVWTYKKPKLTFLLTGLITLIMYGDILYYRYFMDYLSVKLLNQVTFVGSVMEIVVSIIRPFDFILFIDIALLFLLRKNLVDFKLFKKRKAFVAAMLIFPTVILSISFSQVYTGIKEYEFFNYHVYDLISADFENSRLTSEDRKDIITSIVKQQVDSVDAQHFGVGKDMNLMVIQLESFQNDFIGAFYRGQEILPNLNALIKDQAFYFDHYYQQLGKGNTSDAEFASLNSLYPILTGNTYNVYESNAFMGLPWIMRENGYQATSYHGYVASFWNRENIYPHEGFETSYFERDYIMGDKIVFGLDDYDFFMQSLDKMKGRSGKQFDFLVSLSSHKPYSLQAEKQFLDVPKEEVCFFTDHLQSIHYVDHVLGQTIEKLKEEGLYEKTVLVIYGDHFGIGVENKKAFEAMEDFLGRSYKNEDLLNIPLIIRVPGLGESQTISTSGGQIDLLPTLLNIMGVENEYVTFGQDLLNAKEGLVLSQTFMGPGSFITDTVVYEASKDQVFENGIAYDRDTHEPVRIEPYRRIFEKAFRHLELSKRVTEADAVHDLLLEYKEYRYGVIEKE